MSYVASLIDSIPFATSAVVSDGSYGYQSLARPTGILGRGVAAMNIVRSEDALTEMHDALIMGRDVQLETSALSVPESELVDVLEKIQALEEQVRKMLSGQTAQNTPSQPESVPAPVPDYQSKAIVGGPEDESQELKSASEEPSNVDDPGFKAVVASDMGPMPEVPEADSYTSLTFTSTTTTPSTTIITQSLTETVPLAPSASSAPGGLAAAVGAKFAQLAQGWSNSSTSTSASLSTLFPSEPTTSTPAAANEKQLFKGFFYANTTASSLSSGFRTSTRSPE